MTRWFVYGLFSWILVSAPQTSMAGAVQAVSAANPSLPPVAGANNDSSASVISADGRFVLFLSSANNLVTNDDSGKYLDVFLRNRTNNTTTLVSVNRTGLGGGNGHSISPVISADGRYVAFESEAANLVAGDTNNASDVFVRDLLSGRTTLVSVNLSGNGPGNGASSSPLISSDGRYVAFVSAANDLVTNDSNSASDVFLRDLQKGTTTLASVRADGSTGGNGDSDSPAMTPDGRWLVFVSKATDLVAGVTNIMGEIYARDFVSGTTVWVSTNALPIWLTVTPATNYLILSYNPVISADGKVVAFKTSGWASPRTLLLRHDLETGTTGLISTNAICNVVGIGDASGPDLTPDGRFVAFAEATFSNQTYSAVYLWDASTGTRALVSANLSGTISSNTLSDTPAVSADGRFVAFLSDATDLVTNAADGSYQVYLRDTVAGMTKLVSADLSGGVSGDAGGAIPTVTADGRYVAFDSGDGNYVANDNNNAFDVYVRDTATDTTELISRAHATIQTLTGDGLSTVSARSLSADGRFIAFVSLADNLTTKDTGGFQNVFVRDLQTGTNILVSINSAGAPSATGSSFSPVISSNGRYVAFVSNAADLTANQTNRSDNIFLRDLQAGTTTLISVSADDATSGNAASSSPRVSSDGRYVVFFSLAKNLVPNDSTAGGEIFWRDTQSGTTVAVSTEGRATGVTGTLSMSDDGRYVAYANGLQPQLHVWDSLSFSNIFATPAGTFGALFFNTLGSDGRTLVFEAFSSSNHSIVAHNLVAGTDRIIGYSAVTGGPKAQVSGNGRFVTFVSAANAPNTPNGATNVFLYDLQTETTTLVSFNHDRTGSGNGTSDSPSISADGRFVTYRSFANDLMAGDNNNQGDVFVFDRQTGSNALVSVNQTGAGPGNDWSSTPVISADGGTIAFRSLATDLVAGDLNNTEDVFVFRVPVVAFTDSDGDGMDDTWEMAQFGDLSRNGSGDSDGDGASDLNEYKAGTDPMNAASSFRVEATVSLETGQTTMRWEAAPGRSYRVQYTDDLGLMIWKDLPGGVGIIGSTATCVDTTTGVFNQRFYRVTLVE